MARKKSNPHVGSDIESFLEEEGRLGAATSLAVKRVLAWELQQARARSKVTQAELARRMKTSRAVVHRLLDETDWSIKLATVNRAASALGQSVQLKLGR